MSRYQKLCQGSRQPRPGDSGPPAATDSQDFPTILSIASGSVAVPTRDDGGDDLTIVLKSPEKAAREMFPAAVPARGWG